MAVYDKSGTSLEHTYSLNGDEILDLYKIVGRRIFNSQYDLPAYWLSYLSNKVPEIVEQLNDAGDSVLPIIYITDYHENDYSYESANAGYSSEIIRYLVDQLGVQRVVFCGDVYTKHQSKQDALNSLASFASKFAVGKNYSMSFVKGNHDDNNYGVGQLSNAEILSSYYSYIGKNSAYYYTDIPAKKVRLVFLDTRQTSIDYSLSNGDATEKAYVTTEVNWLIDTLNGVPSGYSVVVFMHAIWWGAGSLSTGSLIPSETGGVQGVLSLYNSKSSGVVFDTIPADFTSANGEALFCISGHTHLDYSHLIRGIVCLSSSSDSYVMANIRPDNRTHAQGTVTEHVLDVLLIDTENKKLKTIRIGSGQDREFNLSGASIGQKCSVTRNLTGCSSSNSSSTAYGSYSTTITANTGKTISSYSVSVYGFTVGSQYLTLSNDSTTLTINLPCVYGDVIVNCTAS